MKTENFFLLMLCLSTSTAFIAAVIGFVYATILTAPDQILGGWKKFVHNTYDRITGVDTPKNQKYRWILKPIVDCELCVAGQVAFWSYVLILPWVSYYIYFLIFTVCLAILITKALYQLLH